MTKQSIAIDLDLIDQLLKGYKSPEDVLGENDLLKQLSKAALERALKAELSHHRSTETDLPGIGQHQQELDKADKGMEGSAQSVCDSL